MDFRPLTEIDLASAPGWFGEIELRADRWRDDGTRSAVALDEAGAVIGVGMLWTSRAHHDRYWTDLVVVCGGSVEARGDAPMTHAEDRDLVTLFTKALRKLGEAGQPEEASMLGGQAWWALKDTDPRGAERVNGTMHYLARLAADSTTREVD